ncbi:hypothetical protein [Bartonella raoultii]|nr:hypothetical protein [Bartonella raoultii]
MHKGLNSAKESEKEKREAMRNLHFLIDIAVDTFERRKIELVMIK